jgi:hypothetical protein
MGPLVQVSSQSPFGDLENCGIVPGGRGLNFLHSEVEPWIDVNPTNPDNIVALWQQDRWSNGGSRGSVAGVSFDGGMSWEIVVVDGLSDCSNGEFERASDPWLSFAPDGTLHQISLMVNIDDNALFGVSRSAMGVSKSTDGGLTWSEPILIIDDIDPSVINDKETITADPTDANLVYVVWDRLAPVPGSTYMEGPTYFSRTTDGGTTWEAARILYDPGINNQTLNNQIVVLPNVTLLTFFTEIINFPATSFPSYLSVVVSTDQGQTWSRVKRLAPISALGDYVGLAAHDDFLAYVPQSFPADAANGFFRRVPAQIDTNVADSPLVLRPRQQVVSEEPDIGSVWPATLLDVERVNPGMRIAW